VAWIFRILSVAAATITSLFVAGDALNFSIVQTFVTITLIVGFGIAAVGWSMRRDI
jgi:FtsH-binding integral membrane protein